MTHRRKDQHRVKDPAYPDDEYDVVGTSKGIFEDPSVLQARALQAQQKKERLEAKKGPLEDIFDGDEIDDQFATKQDKAIAEKDIPERLQIKVAE